MNLDSKLSMDITSNGQQVLGMKDNASINLLRFGAAFKMNDFVIQPMVTMNEGKDKRYSISAIFKL